MKSTGIKSSDDHAGVPASAEETVKVPAASVMPEEPAQADRIAQVAAARARAGQCFAEQRYAEARKALEEADALEKEPNVAIKHTKRVINDVRSKWNTVFQKKSVEAQAEPATPLDTSIKTVSLYSKIGAGVGLLPFGLINFAGVLAVQVAMVWKICKIYGKTEGKERIRGSVLSLIGASVPVSVGQTVSYAIPAVIAGTVLFFIVTPVLAFAMTQAVGKAFIMHFESGGTLLTFNPKAFQEYFLQEFKKAGGTVETA